ncbi:hypothetical protein GCM10023093_29090 [Nemorincola caseinilytica]|uniref:Uncharacterized protein n=2 Tax=Nemorincola caseinilytica TaxID=2054315 RepID=A0ABP8NLW9_9BACT
MHAEIVKGEKNILVISNIGNGKSTTVEALAYTLLQDDYQVFRYEKAYDSLNMELEYINRQQKPVIILESYAQNKDFLETLLIHRTNKGLVLVVTERTAIYETSIQTLEKLTNKSVFAVHDINSLDAEDIEGFSKLLTLHGLWGNDMKLTEPDKLSLIKRQCHSATREVLLHILKSENIISKFSVILNALQTKKEYYHAIILILTASRYNVNIDLQFVNQVLNTLNIRSTNFDNNLAIKELIDFESDEIKIRSSIVSEVLLEHVSEVKPLIDSLIEICMTVDEWEDETSKALIREYMSYSNLKWLLYRKERDVNEMIFYFFEKIRNLKSCRNNHHYWLQCAILDIERQNFELAHKHLETAYSLASKGRRYSPDTYKIVDTYQIDNQKANLLLKEVIAQKDANTAMLKFREAHKTLTRAADPNRLRHYPYKVADLYIDFHRVFYDQLSDGQKQSLIDAFDEMVKKMDEYLRQVIHYREKSFVSQTRADLVQLISNFRNPKAVAKPS